jgi:phage gpG-like protein
VNVSVSLKTASLDAYKANLDKITLVVGKAAADVEANAKDSILTNSGHYKEYKRGKNKFHWSSIPGTPPNSDTGNLANSINHSMMASRAESVTALVKANAKYAVPLELGWTSKGGNTVPARPFMTPALMKVRPAFVRAMREIMKGQ